jgi:hypothetical protein
LQSDARFKDFAQRLDELALGISAILSHNRKSMKLLLAPWRGLERTLIEDARVRRKVMTHYALDLPNTNDKARVFRDMFGFTGIESDEAKGVYLPSKQFQTAHIWPAHLLGRGLEFFGYSEFKYQDPNLCMYLPRTVEIAFNHMQVTFVWNILTKKLYLKVLDPAIKHDLIFCEWKSKTPFSGYPHTFSGIDGWELFHSPAPPPSRRLIRSWLTKLQRSKAGLAPRIAVRWFGSQWTSRSQVGTWTWQPSFALKDSGLSCTMPATRKRERKR